MNIRDTGIIIARRPLKESSIILSLFSESHGIYSGVVRSISRKSSFTYQLGNLVSFSWNSRLEEHIGNIECELIKSYTSYLLNDKTKLYAINSIISLIILAFHERELHNSFFPVLKHYIEGLRSDFDFTEYIRIELEILAQSGYELQLERCAVTNNQHDLRYVSPKSGKAVSASAGAAYADKLLLLPQFLASSGKAASIEEKEQAINLLTYFLNRYFVHSNNQLLARNIFVKHIIPIPSS